MNNENRTGGAPPKAKRGLLIGILIGLAILLVLAAVVFATPLKDVFKKKNAPEISLELIGEQPAEEGHHRFEVEALVTGSPLPEVSFSRDDSAGEAGENRAWILLAPGEQYTLTATAKNSAGQDSASLELEAPDESAESQETDTSQKAGTAEKTDSAEKTDPAEKADPAKKNSSPVIKEITIDKDVVFVGVKYQITAVASDPDGDPLTYEWSGDGSIAGTKANPMTWTAPEKTGDYTIKVTVKDGRGGAATLSKTITVNKPLNVPTLKKTTTLSPVTGGESGWIIKNKSIIPTATYAGDNKYNQMVRGLISFDISKLAGKTVTKVVLHMKNPEEYGNPAAAMGEMRLGTARWGPRPLKLEDYNLSGRSLGAFSSYEITITSSPEGASETLANELQKCIKEGLNRFQYRFQFSKDESNNDNKPDGVQYEFADISLFVEYY